MASPTPSPIFEPTFEPTKLFSCSQGSLLSDSHVGLAANDWVVIWNTIALYGAAGLVLLLVFEAFRGKKSVFLRRTNKLKHRTPKEPGRYPLQWIPPVFSLSNDEVRRMVGLDGYVCIRYIMWCLKVCTFCSFWGLVVLLPLYYSGGHVINDPWGVFTMDNIKDGTGWGSQKKGTKLWISCMFNAIFTIYALYTMNIEWVLFTEHRAEFLAQGDPDAKGGAQLSYSVRVESLPKELRSDLALYAYFDNLFPGQVHSAVVHLKVDNLLSLIEKRQVACEKLELALANKAQKKEWRVGDLSSLSSVVSETTSSPSLKHSPVILAIVEDGSTENPTEWIWCSGDPNGQSRCCGLAHAVDSISLHAAMLDELNEQVKLERESVVQAGNQVEDSFTTRLRAQIQTALRGEPASETTQSEHEDEGGVFTGALKTGEKVVTGAFKTGVGVITDDFRVIADTTILGISTVSKGLKFLTVGESKSSSAYVSFKTKVASADAVQVLLAKDELQLTIIPAPDPRDLIWANATVGARESVARKNISTLLLVLFALTGFIPLLIAINGSGKFFVKIEQNKPVSKWFSSDDALDDEHEESTLDVLLETQLPVILQVTLIALLPLLFTFLSEYYEKAKSQSEVQKSVLSRYYGFTLVNILSTFGVRNLLDVLKAILKEPSCLVDLLGSSIPANASYFAQYIVIKTLIGLPLELCRIWPLIRVVWFQKFQRSGASRRSIALLQEETSEFCSGWIYPNFLLVIVVCFSYAVIAPFLMVFGVFYFALALVIYKHQLLYVYIPRYETGGSLFETLYGYTLTGLNFANVTMIGYVALKQGYMQVTFLVFPLILLVEYFRSYTKRAYVRQTTVLSREVAVAIDRKCVPKPPLSPGSGSGESSSLLDEEGSGEDSPLDEPRRPKSLSARYAAATSLSSGEVTAPPHLTFDENLYRQPALRTGALYPLPPKLSKLSKRDREVRGRATGVREPWKNVLEDDGDYDDEDEDNIMSDLTDIEQEIENGEDLMVSVSSPHSDALLSSEHHLQPVKNYKSTEESA